MIPMLMKMIQMVILVMIRMKILTMIRMMIQMMILMLMLMLMLMMRGAEATIMFRFPRARRANLYSIQVPARATREPV